MIKADHTLIGKLVCDYYSGYKLEKAFNPIRIIGSKFDSDLPILMVSNHFSWWDGFIQHRLNRRLFKRKFHVMMLEEQLEKFTILNKGGAFSVRKNSRAVIDSLNYCLELLQDKNNLVLIFPQGKIESIHTPKLHFERGLSYLLSHSRKDFQLIFNANLIDYFSDKQPSLSIYFKKYMPRHFSDIHTLEEDYNNFFNGCRRRQEAV